MCELIDFCNDWDDCPYDYPNRIHCEFRERLINFIKEITKEERLVYQRKYEKQHLQQRREYHKQYKKKHSQTLFQPKG